MDRHNCTDTIYGATLSSALPLSWHGWFEDGKKLFIAEAKQAMITVRMWRMRSASRRRLAQMDEHLLRDIGLSAKQVREETAKCFWEN